MGDSTTADHEVIDCRTSTRLIRSTTVPQSLTLFNSELSLAAARDLGSFVWKEAGPRAKDQVEMCYRRALSRESTPTELAVGVEFLRHQAERLRKEGRDHKRLITLRDLRTEGNTDVFAAAALADVCLGLFNLNEFIYVD